MKYLKYQKGKNWLLPAAVVVGVGALGGGSTLRAAETPKADAPKTAMDKSAPQIPVVIDQNFLEGGGSNIAIGPDGSLKKAPPQVVADAPIFDTFQQWLNKYNAAAAAQKPALEAEGIRLATERRKALAALIPTNPKRAIELSIGLQERRALPTGVVQELGDILQGRGEYGVVHTTTLVDVPVPNKPDETQKGFLSGYKNYLTFDGRAYNAYVYGKRDGLVSKTGLPFRGVAVDNVVAIDESPIWVLKPGQTPPATAKPSKYGTKCPVCGQDATNGIVGIVGSTIYYFDTQKDLVKFRDDLWAAEAIVGPKEHG